jgi:hypothetical protein
VSRAITRTLLVTLSTTLLAGALAHNPSWQIGPFVRPESGNPVIAPKAASEVEDPVRAVPVHWEALHTFNPAAVVRNGVVDVLYRAEDDTGAMQIGMHTSRLGMAESVDGIHFTRRPTPVFYPENDSQKSREWPAALRIHGLSRQKTALTY